jgi:RNA polymerase sigma-70 factor (ECF subfamily)
MADITIGAHRLTGGADHTTDETLIRRCQQQDTEAFRWLIERYESRVYSYVRRMLNNREESEDVTLEVFVKAYRSINRFKGGSSMATWLLAIATNLCVDRVRHRKRRVELASFEDFSPGSLPEPRDATWDPAAKAAASDLGCALEVAMGALPQMHRTVILLHDVEGLDYREIAEVLGIPLGTVKSRLFLARKRLRRALNPYLVGEDND